MQSNSVCLESKWVSLVGEAPTRTWDISHVRVSPTEVLGGLSLFVVKGREKK